MLSLSSMVKVGIPRALLYYRYYPFWEAYFKKLGATVVISQKTSREILEKGIRHTVDDICLPVKVFHGHVINLCGNVDCIFIPRVVSVERNAYTCPKFIGLPDMIKSSIPNLPYVIDTVINVKERPLWLSSLCLGFRFTKNPLKIWNSYKSGKVRQVDFEHNGGIPKEVEFGLNNGDLNIGVVGHPYIIYDSYLNLGLLSKLRKIGVSIITSTQIEPDIINRELKKYKGISWSYEKEIVGSISYFLGNGNVDGIIFLQSFGCGPSSIILEIINREVRKNRDIPFLTLVIDEHTEDTGILTRVESFIDTIRMRKK